MSAAPTRSSGRQAGANKQQQHRRHCCCCACCCVTGGTSRWDDLAAKDARCRQMKTVRRLKSFAKKAGISLRHLQRLNAAGLGPPLIDLGKRIKGVGDDDGDAWFAKRRKLPPGWVDTPCTQSLTIEQSASTKPTPGQKIDGRSARSPAKDSRRRRIAGPWGATGCGHASAPARPPVESEPRSSAPATSVRKDGEHE
jgi:hypothetical protein